MSLNSVSPRREGAGPYAASLVTLFVATALTACGGGETPPADSGGAVADSAVTATASAAAPAPTEGFSTPESVRYDAELDVYYVSNINGVPSEKDGNGFIARIDATNPTTSTMLVEGGKNGATLNAPKGMAISGDTLWVADIDALRGFDRKTGAPLATLDLSPLAATFLNDVAIGPDGVLYVTDTGIRIDAAGNVTHPGVDRIFAVRGGKPAVALEGDILASPNGIAWDAANSRFVLAPFGANTISAWKVGEKALTEVAKGAGGFDGIEVLADGRILVTSWADSSLSVIAGGTLTRVAGSLEAPADIGVDSRRALVAVPRFNARRVDYISIPK